MLWLHVAGITLGTDGVLIIERVKKDDEGLYECVAKNDEGTAKTTALVTVLGKSPPPIITRQITSNYSRSLL